MSEHTRSFDGAALSAQAEGIRRLARHLLFDRVDAEDVAQEAMLAALEARPPAERLREWLRGVTRNLARGIARSEVRRRAREREAARPESLPAADEALVRVAEQRRLLASVVALDEPYRTVIVLRFFDSLPPRAIARRLGVPVETVRTRTRRALALLRARLREQHGGDDSAWALALAPLVFVKGKSTAVGAVSGVLLVTKTKLAMIATIVVAIILLWASRPWRGSAPTIDAPVQPSPAESVAAASPSPSSRAGTAEPPPSEGKSPSESESASSTLADGKRRLRGTIVVEDEAGVVHEQESGSFEAYVATPTHSTSTSVAIEVERGSWHVDMPPGYVLQVNALRLGGRDASLRGGGPQVFEFPADGRLALRALWPGPIVLHVRAKGDGHELGGVEFLAGGLPERSEGMYPDRGRTKLLASGVPSPVLVSDHLPEEWPHMTGFLGPCHVFARSPSFAWGRIEIDFSKGGDYFLDLEPSGDLVVSVSGNWLGVALRLYPKGREDGDPYAEFQLDESPNVAIESLPAGHYQVRAEVGWSRRAAILGFGEVDVPAGARARHALHVKNVPSARRVSVSGVLRVPRALVQRQLALWAALQGPPIDGVQGPKPVFLTDKASDGEDDLYPFRFEELQPGTYELRVSELSVSFGLEVGSSGASNVQLTVAAPARLRVHVLDSDTGEEADVLSLAWKCQPAGYVSQRSFVNVTRKDRSQPFEFDVPQMEVDLRADAEGYVDVEAKVLVHEGLNDVVLKVSRTCQVLIVVRDGDRELAWREGWQTPLYSVDGSGGHRAMSGYSPRGHLARVTKPGRYRFKFLPKLDGYRDVPEQEVDVVTGKTVEHVIQLEREP